MAIARGLADRLAAFALLVVLSFLLPRLMPGDPLDTLLSSEGVRLLSAGERAAIRHQMGLDGSWAGQFARHVGALLRGDLGFSRHHAAPVANVLFGAAPWTLLLVAGALPVFLAIGVGAGIEAGRQPHRLVDRLLTAAMTLIASIPPFAAAVFLLLAFAVLWPVLPAGGGEPLFPPATTTERVAAILRHAVLPSLALSLHEIGRFYFVSRGEAASLSTRAFIVNARARGIGGWRERIHYFGRNMLPMVLARTGTSITGLFGAVFYVEFVFSYPGLGKLVYDAILERDYALLQGVLLALAAIVLLLNWLVDALVAVLAGRG